MNYRIERDTMGEVRVPADKIWGAQTQRSLENFKIGTEKMPRELVEAFAMLKKSLALVNHDLGKLDQTKKEAIVAACDEIIAGGLEDAFPLSVWQTGSGTQSNMNMNEVIAHRAMQILGEDFTQSKTIHPNDHVNMSQSSNDTFPTAMHIATVLEVEKKLKISKGLLRSVGHTFRMRHHSLWVRNLAGMWLCLRTMTDRSKKLCEGFVTLLLVERQSERDSTLTQSFRRV